MGNGKGKKDNTLYMGRPDDAKYVNWLYHVPGIGRKTLSAMLAGGLHAEELCAMNEERMRMYLKEVCKFSERMSAALAEKVNCWKRKCDAQRLWDKILQKEICFVLPNMEAYPERLKQIPDAPLGLYIKGGGDFRAMSEKRRPVVAVVGARTCSEYGKYVARRIGQKCAQRGVMIVSGMALGVDGISQWGGLEAGGLVAAVLGCGADICYPEANLPIYNALCEKGCIYSEYAPGTEPRSNFFPPRNRIISGMADVLVVVEAKERSGTLITVDMALEQGKEVYVIPGRVTDPMSVGCNQLIRQGASVICDLDSFVEEIANTGLHHFGSAYEEQCAEEESGCSPENPYPVNSLRNYIYNALDINP
nr:DNA-processing protein DprA [Lachnospiraceae bacterium]